ncbi:PREDICTED: homeobox-leucine zipper protein ROC2-like [Erythranthe guttata]|uniref:homeobox-leucine zipper protein ROC2-like n=1 Tax=Erythranthe guttata TaxID=4155 RepID=UPI00064DA878|nr:PREDICTED: homeobox-leucine zipper protein ROC2-like [Erythranthe guttata]|eukprot:XP_012850835.1 PREDICTED: homeobox-leucine zipper protein ROC2-like [Erythranthe guttata]
MNSNVSEGDDIRRTSDEEINSKSDNDNSIGDQRPRRKHYHRHTSRQIQEMEAFFKECPHPDDRQRKELSRELGLEPMQIKFWFQNKRTQMKAQHEHQENTNLRNENEKLRAENMRYKEVLSNASCSTCCGPTPIRETSFQEQQLVIENARLRQEIDHISAITSKYLGKPVTCMTDNPSSSSARRLVSFGTSKKNGRSIDIAIAAMEELVRVARLGEPLWVPSVDRNFSLLNEEEYLRSFTRVFGPKPNGYKSEASRECAVVSMCATNIVEILMEVVLVDVSLDHLHSTSLITCRRRPSGCVIQDMPNGCSKVTWVENIEVEEGGGHSIYKPLITAGLAFGAKRWIAILDGYCQRVASATDIPPSSSNSNYLANEEGRKSLLKLAERMIGRFCNGVNASINNTWTTLSGIGNDSVKVITRKNVDDPTMPFGIQLCVATSFWLPIPPKRVFNFLRNLKRRKEWDMLSSGAEFREMAHIVSGDEIGNRVALYQDMSSREGKMILLQESRTDQTASYVVYAPMDPVYVSATIGGGDPNHVPLLPSGFAILPDGPTGGQGRGTAAQVDSGGSLLTVAHQVSSPSFSLFFFVILVDSSPNAKISMGSIAMANQIISCTVDNIKKALIP